MTNQLLSRPTQQPSKDHQIAQIRKSYQAIQQVKYLHLKAEIDILLQQLKSIKENTSM
ncbi:MAG: aspartate kinase [Cyanobacteria bacterium P01_G01_bin.49]